MDIIIHWGVLRHLASEVNARAGILITAIVLDVVVLIMFLFIKGKSDPMIIVISTIGIITVFALEHFFLRSKRGDEGIKHDSSHA